MADGYGYDGPYGYAPYGYGFDDVVGPPVLLSAYELLPDVSTLTRIVPTLRNVLGPFGVITHSSGGYGYDAPYGYSPYGYGYSDAVGPTVEVTTALQPSISAPAHLVPVIRYVDEE